MRTNRFWPLSLRLLLITLVVTFWGCSSSSPTPPANTADLPPSANGSTVDPGSGDGEADNARGSGSIGGWRSAPGQRTIFNRGFRIPTTISFRADGGNWSGSVSIVDTSSNRSLCERSIGGGQQTSCFGIQGNFRITVANNSSSRDTATGQIRFNN